CARHGWDGYFDVW
nr:immunoglobulin heavy chain junction region [Mus musculus]MBK4187920.1 immunoglobulin heavy chain junction region [Mus musculus]